MPTPTVIDELPALTDQDVHLLGSIIFAAAKIPGPPFRALFTAYDQILAERGISPGSDQIYFRFLLRMGEERAEDDTLFGRFRSLLESEGIHVEIDGENHLEEITRRLDVPNDLENTKTEETAQKKRRASFDSALDHLTDADRPNDVFKGSASKYHDLQHQRPSSRAEQFHPSNVELVHQETRRSKASHGHSNRGRVNTRMASEQLPLRPRRHASVSSQGSLRITRHHSSAASNPKDAYSADESENTDLDEDNGDMKEVSAAPPGAREPKRQNADKGRTHNDQVKLSQMHQVALERDRYALLRSGFGMWFDKFQLRRQELETENFFAHMERRAGRARGLFLIAKAFTHWAQSASDEINKTSIARRHILRTRYFNAWKDITAVNALKIRRQGLRKFLGLWRNRTANNLEAHIDAVVHYEQNLVSRIYWRWFWNFCGRRAPLWGEQRLKQAYMLKWRSLTVQSHEKEVLASDFAANALRTKAFSSWRTTVSFLQLTDTRAAEFRKRSLLSTTLSFMRKEAKLRLPSIQQQHTVESNLLKTAFGTWRFRLQQEQHAVEWSNHRIKHNVWSQWKQQIVASHINERVVVQALYKWMLSARMKLMRRVHDTTLQRWALIQWRLKAAARERILSDASEMVHTAQRTRVLHTVLRVWINRTHVQQQNEHLAFSSFEHRQKANAMYSWKARHHQLQTLDQWSSDARFYVSTKHALAAWQSATLKSQRAKRRETYALVRRKNKMELARRMMHRWHQALELIRASEEKATKLHNTKLNDAATRVLVSWQEQSQMAMDIADKADSFDRQRVLVQVLQTWTMRLSNVRHLQAIGATLEKEFLAETFVSSLKKLKRRNFQIQQQDHTALALQGQFFKNHVRNMLRCWALSAGLRNSGEGADPDEHAFDDNNFDHESPQQRNNFANLEETGLDLEDVNADFTFPPDDPEEGFGGTMITSTPLPAYLRTPSKRTVRAAKVRERLQVFDLNRPQTMASTTPAAQPDAIRRGAASAPIPGFRDMRPSGSITPFARKMNAEGFSASTVTGRPILTPGRGRWPGRARPQVGFAGFDDIQETEQPEQ